jgi:hypothetical protein
VDDRSRIYSPPSLIWVLITTYRGTSLLQLSPGLDFESLIASRATYGGDAAHARSPGDRRLWARKMIYAVRSLS